MDLKKYLSNRSLLWGVAALAALLLLLMLNSGSTAGTGTREEKRIAQVLSLIDGAGQVEVALFYAPGDNGTTGSPTGAVVVAQGAEKLPVRLELIRALRTLLSLPESAVDVFTMNDP